ncbi:MAG: sugar phosphate isomerase/epimerase, partial [Hadesarchaea archaeon]|nr:sugar phosphate isomerase/epimerase [Hadesarchaea archaeon]
FSDEQKQEIKETADSMDITISLHLPYTYIGASLCCFQESDRKIAAEHSSKCTEFAADIGAEHVVTHPGKVPFYQAEGEYREMAKKSLVKSLMEINEVCEPAGIDLHLENNVAFHNFLTEIDECLEILQKTRDKEAKIYFNFDIGHWFTRADIGKSIPDNPIKEINKIPSKYIKELHLNDYVPEEKIFHPPIHLQWGPLKREVLENYAELVNEKKAETIVLETSLKNIDQFRDRDEILENEAEYVCEIFDV